MKPLSPAIKYPLAIIISAMVLAPGFIAFFEEDPGVTQTKKFAADAEKATEELRKRSNTQNSNSQDTQK